MGKHRHKFNRLPSRLDGTEERFDHAKELTAIPPLPAEFDLRPKCPPIMDQGNEGSCTAHSGVFCRMMLTNITGLLSRAFLYYEERKIEKTTKQDSGASMKDMITAIKNCGICPEQDMPYVAGNYTTIPPVKAVKDALVNKITGGKMVTGVDGIKTALVTRSQAVAVGMTVYSSMESNSVAKTGILPMPKAKEKQLGGHAVSIVGYKPSIAIKKKLFRKAVVQTGWFIVENSWGTGWGDKGYFYMPYEYVVKGYADEFWIMNI